MEKVSDNPLTVKYTINEGVKWSDGTPVTAADLVLQWAAFSGYYDDADAEARPERPTSPTPVTPPVSP